MKEQRLRQILERASEQRVLVIGDLMLDEFVWGMVGRISPEAPVPVVEVSSESCYPGGAANVARNLRQFAERISVAGMVGRDTSGERLRVHGGSRFSHHCENANHCAASTGRAR